MKWFKKTEEPTREPVPKPTSDEKAPKTLLQIEELEERITPNAIWGD